MRKRPCLLFACIFLTGIVLQRYDWKCLWFVPLIILISEIYYAKRIAGRSILLLSAFFLGMTGMKSQEDFRSTYMSNLMDGSDAAIFGEILTIQETEYGNRLILTDCYIRQMETTIPCNQVMVYVSSDQFLIGQIYQMNGTVKLFAHARNEGNFDSAVFYQSQKIDFSLYATEWKLLAFKENGIRDVILEIKARLIRVYQNYLEEIAAGFYIGMMLGDKSFLSEQTEELFSVGGISHILAISGLHMSIIGRGLYRVLRKIRSSFLIAGIVSAVLLLAYCFMVGNGVSATRAVGMMLLFFLAQYLGRSYDMLNALGVMMVYLLCDNPFLIEYSGFQFSVAALLGVGFVGKIIPMPMAITLSTLPIVASCYFEIPFYSPLVNMLVLPVLTPVFLLAVSGGLMGLVSPMIGNIILIPCGWLYNLYELICGFVETLPYGRIITGKPGMEYTILYYVILFGGILFAKKKISLKILLCVTCFLLIVHPQKAVEEIIFLDVGQGDAIYFASEDGTTCFVDGGSSDVKEVGKYRILPFLKAHGVKKIEYWFISHADNDHMSGFLEVMKMGYPISYLVVSSQMPADENKDKLLQLARKNNISVLEMETDDRIQSTTGGIRVTCLYPWSYSLDRNEQSMVLLLEYLNQDGNGIYKALFTGDISKESEMELLRKGILEEVDLYKAAHHGSKYSNSEELLSCIGANTCIISCGKDNSYGHPHKESIQRLQEAGVELYYTMENGQITIEVGEHIQIHPWLR